MKWTRQILSAVHVAADLGENVEQVFKTLVLQGDKTGYFVCIIPGDKELNLKLAAKVSGNKSCDLISDERITASYRLYPRGLLTPRNEETFSYLYTRNLPSFSFYFRECRTTRTANKSGT